MNEEVVYQGNIIEVVHGKTTTGGEEEVFEFARRSPGIRLIIPSGDKLVLTREYRRELKNWDYRLPGGKVFDTLAQYNEFLKNGGNILDATRTAAMREAREEVGIAVKEMKHFYTSKCGATVEWDLFYFVVESFDSLEGGQELEYGEDIEVIQMGRSELEALSLKGGMQEDRSVGVLLRYLANTR